MNQSSNRRNKQNQIGKYSAIFTDENNHSFNSGTTLSLQSMVDDIPFEFNPKYRTIIAARKSLNDKTIFLLRGIKQHSAWLIHQLERFADKLPLVNVLKHDSVYFHF
ncbi:unnamed protein product [Rotaria socialis]